uniref:oligosaccharide flippase family protein n=1 Tax=Flavobacterium sp. TaxID=239 RepID=UPI0040480896
MGIVIKQSIKNTIITYIGFGIGAVNTLFMYAQFLGDTFYGLVGFILSAANIMMPLMAFGVHNTLVKFYNEYDSDAKKIAVSNICFAFTFANNSSNQLNRLFWLS